MKAKAEPVKRKGGWPKGRPRAKRGAVEAPSAMLVTLKQEVPGVGGGARETIAERQLEAQKQFARAKQNLQLMGVIEWDPELDLGERVFRALLQVWKKERRPPTIQDLIRASGLTEQIVWEQLDFLEEEDRVFRIHGGIYIPNIIGERGLATQEEVSV